MVRSGGKSAPGIFARIESARMPIRPQVVDSSELEGLPAPVQQFFRNVLKHGQPIEVSV
jgi:hypothetical protein